MLTIFHGLQLHFIKDANIKPKPVEIKWNFKDASRLISHIAKIQGFQIRDLHKIIKNLSLEAGI
jgi:hypothetical protein